MISQWSSLFNNDCHKIYKDCPLHANSLTENHVWYKKYYKICDLESWMG